MHAIVMFLTLALADTPAVRKPHPFAPSLPQLNKDEIAAIEKVVDRFVLYDLKRLPDGDGKKAVQDFQALGPEAFFVLLDRFNQAAERQDSCPAVLLGRKISSIVQSSNDIELLTFAKENAGGGVTGKRHLGTIKDLQFTAQLRRTRIVERLNGGLFPDGRPIAKASFGELTAVVEKDRGLVLTKAIEEIARREDAKSKNLLAMAAANGDFKNQLLARQFLIKKSEGQDEADLKKQMKHEDAELRAAAVKVAGLKKLPWGEEYLEAMMDPAVVVQRAGHQSLVKLSGVDHGPRSFESPGEVLTAVERWKTWWAARKK